MAKKSKVCANWPKFVLQWGVLAVLIIFLSGLAAKIFPGLEASDPERLCPFGGLEALATYIQADSLPCSMSSLQILMGIAVAAAVVLFSKLFCAFICPIGAVEDLLKKLRESLKIKALVIAGGSVADKVLRIVKYALLFLLFYMTIGSSELFCKHLDPYYAVATGFKGEITLWMSLVTVGIVILLGFIIDRFWCRYICPLGAISNTFKFWIYLLGFSAVFVILGLLGVSVNWVIVLAAFCLLGYLLEIINGHPKMQILHVVRDESRCAGTCLTCQKSCPYTINVPKDGKKVTSVDCMLCGECVAACPSKALSIGIGCKSSCRFLPPILTIVITVAAVLAGGRFEVPTIDVQWGVEQGMKLETVRIEGLRTVKCYSSSMAFKAKMEKVKGVHGVKTFVASHTVVVSYDPTVVTEDEIQRQVFVPSTARISSPDPNEYPELKVVTIRTEHMHDKTDLSYLGLQFGLRERKIFGLDSEYDCPLVIHVFMAPDEELDEEFYREVVEDKSLDMPLKDGGIKSTPVDYKFVRLEEGTSTISTKDYLLKMFDNGFHAEYNGRYPSADTTIVIKRNVVYADQPQFIYEIVDRNFEKTVVKRALPFISNHVSREEGVIGMDVTLNNDLMPCIRFRFAAPATGERIWELLTMDTWTITYSKDDVRDEPAKMAFKNPGVAYPVEELE